MDTSLPHQLRYDIEGHVPVAVVAESLVANARLAVEAAFLLEALIPGLVIERAEASVRSLSHESPLTQAFVIALVAAYQKNLERDVPAIVTDLTDYVVPERYHTLLTILVMMIAIYGISKTIERLFPSKKTDKIDESFKSLTLVAGDLIQVAPAQIEATIRGRLADKKQNQLGTAIRGFFAPTAGREGASIIGGGTEISAPALAQIPNFSAPEIEPLSDKIDTKFENNQHIIIHAMDRDRGKAGWAGHIPALFDERISMKLDKSIKPELLFAKTEITGDVLIIYDVDEDGVRTPSEFHLLRMGHALKAKKRKASR